MLDHHGQLTWKELAELIAKMTPEEQEKKVMITIGEGRGIKLASRFIAMPIVKPKKDSLIYLGDR